MKRLHLISAFFCLLFSFPQAQNIPYSWYRLKQQSKELSNTLQNNKVLVGTAVTGAAAGVGTAAVRRIRPIEEIPMQGFNAPVNEIEEAAAAEIGAMAIETEAALTAAKYVMISLGSSAVATISIGGAVLLYDKYFKDPSMEVKYFIWDDRGQEICNGVENIDDLMEILTWDHLMEKCSETVARENTFKYLYISILFSIFGVEKNAFL